MTLALGVLIFVTLQRLSELIIARRNTRELLAKGAVETGAGHYPVMVLLHASWLASLWWFGWDNEVNLFFLALYAALQVFRLWILVTLGRRWTTRILTIPGETLVAKGPYRYIKHPNYLLVLFEVPLLPLALNLPLLAVVFGLLNVMMLAWRIAVENGALEVNSTRK
jgi:methyltransferase